MAGEGFFFAKHRKYGSGNPRSFLYFGFSTNFFSAHPHMTQERNRIKLLILNRLILVLHLLSPEGLDLVGQCEKSAYIKPHLVGKGL